MSQVVSSGCPYSNEALSKGETFAGGAPLELFKAIRGTGAVTWHQDPQSAVGFWAVTRQAELDYVSKNPKRFSSYEKGIMFLEMGEEEIALQRPMLINMDPPDHLKYRQVMRNAFKPKRIEALEGRFKEIFEQVLNKVLARGECDFVSEVAAELPLIAICEILGVPIADREKFFAWTNMMMEEDESISGAMDQIDNNLRFMSMMELFAYADTLMALARENPKDDIVGALLRAELEGEALTDDEFRYFLMLLIVAGNETTRTATSHGMRLFIEHPDQFQHLIDNPDLVADAVEEILRFNAPVMTMRRTAMEDTELGGQMIKTGDKVVLFYQAANHDELVFSDPENFDITRQQREEVRNAHRAFGVGEHFCLGSHLARLELKVIFEGLTKHIRNPQHTGEIEWQKSHTVNGMKTMPIRFDVA